MRGRRVLADAEAVGLGAYPATDDAQRQIVAALLAEFGRADLEAASVVRPNQDALEWAAWSVLIPWRDRTGAISAIQRRSVTLSVCATNANQSAHL